MRSLQVDSSVRRHGVTFRYTERGPEGLHRGMTTCVASAAESDLDTALT